MLSSPALYRLACFCRHLNGVQYRCEVAAMAFTRQQRNLCLDGDIMVLL